MNIVMRNDFPPPVSLRRAGRDQSFERLMHSLFGPHAPSAASTNEDRAFTPPITVTETGSAYEVEAELPGVRKEDVKISLDAGRLLITAERMQKPERKEGEKVLLAERDIRKYSRTITLPEGLDESAIEARLEHGILALTLPKKPAAQPTQITVR